MNARVQLIEVCTSWVIRWLLWMRADVFPDAGFCELCWIDGVVQVVFRIPSFRELLRYHSTQRRNIQYAHAQDSRETRGSGCRNWGTKRFILAEHVCCCLLRGVDVQFECVQRSRGRA